MRFFILGDSWGVGEWQRPNGVFEPVPNTGLDFHLSQAGHTVTNVAQGSAGNFGQLRHTYWTLKENASYDYIIWFHTESIRDIEEILIADPDEGARHFPDFDISNWETGLDYLDHENYVYAQMIWEEFQIPFIVIGGQCSVNPLINKFSFAQHVITSWLAELLELDYVPPKNTFFSWGKIERILAHYNISTRQFIQENSESLDLADKICKIAKTSALFPDDGHPSSVCYQQLAHRIIKLISTVE